MDSQTFIARVRPDTITKTEGVDMILNKLRADIHAFLLQRKIENEFDEDAYNCEMDITKYISVIDYDHIETVVVELETAGWATHLAYGGTCLFIYLGEAPARCRH